MLQGATLLIWWPVLNFLAKFVSILLIPLLLLAASQPVRASQNCAKYLVPNGHPHADSLNPLLTELSEIMDRGAGVIPQPEGVVYHRVMAHLMTRSFEEGVRAGNPRLNLSNIGAEIVDINVPEFYPMIRKLAWWLDRILDGKIKLGHDILPAVSLNLKLLSDKMKSFSEDTLTYRRYAMASKAFVSQVSKFPDHSGSYIIQQITEGPYQDTWGVTRDIFSGITGPFRGLFLGFPILNEIHLQTARLNRLRAIPAYDIGTRYSEASYDGLPTKAQPTMYWGHDNGHQHPMAATDFGHLQEHLDRFYKDLHPNSAPEDALAAQWKLILAWLRQRVNLAVSWHIHVASYAKNAPFERDEQNLMEAILLLYTHEVSHIAFNAKRIALRAQTPMSKDIIARFRNPTDLGEELSETFRQLPDFESRITAAMASIATWAAANPY